MNGQHLIDLGIPPGKHFGELLKMGNFGASDSELLNRWNELCEENVEIVPRTNAIPYAEYITIDDDPYEVENYLGITTAMDKLLRTPTIVDAVIMPDACPAGTIPVGAVVATKNAIHPGFHSADVCCSMYMSILKRGESASRVLDVVEQVAHFGNKQKKHTIESVPANIINDMKENNFLHNLTDVAEHGFMTCGDGNHFITVGDIHSTGETAIISHFGSRGLGAKLYTAGMKAAKKHTKIISPKTDPNCSWLDFDTEIGQEYWRALMIARDWTYANHQTIHRHVAKRLGIRIVDNYFSPHNFVFRKPEDESVFYHAKGATPVFYKSENPAIIPMNMVDPILLVDQNVTSNHALGFAPHGAGRNMSRTKFLNNFSPSRPLSIDARFYNGVADKSEFPEAYKNAETVIKQIKEFDLCNIRDMVIPRGTIMAGSYKR